MTQRHRSPRTRESRRLVFEQMEQRQPLATSIGVFDPHLVSTGPEIDPLAVRFRVELTNREGGSAAEIRAFDDFYLNVYVEDVREDPGGVFAAYVDLLFDSQKVRRAGNIEFGDAYRNVNTGGGSSPGLLDEVGGMSASIQPLGAGEYLLLRAPFRAISAGPVTFSTTAADELPRSLILVYGGYTALGERQIDFGTASMEILPAEPAFSIGTPLLPATRSGPSLKPAGLNQSGGSVDPSYVSKHHQPLLDNARSGLSRPVADGLAFPQDTLFVGWIVSSISTADELDTSQVRKTLQWQSLTDRGRRLTVHPRIVVDIASLPFHSDGDPRGRDDGRDNESLPHVDIGGIRDPRWLTAGFQRIAWAEFGEEDDWDSPTGHHEPWELLVDLGALLKSPALNEWPGARQNLDDRDRTTMADQRPRVSDRQRDPRGTLAHAGFPMEYSTGVLLAFEEVSHPPAVDGQPQFAGDPDGAVLGDSGHDEGTDAAIPAAVPTSSEHEAS